MLALNLFDRFTLRKRVTALAACAIFGFVTIGVVQFWSDRKIEQTSSDYAATDAAYEKLNQLERLLLTLRVAEQNLRAERYAEALPAVTSAEESVTRQLARVQEDPTLSAIEPELASSLKTYLGALEDYSGILAQLGYRDRQSVQVTEEGQAGIDSPTGFSVDLSNAVAKLATRIAEELEFDDQAAVFQVNAAFDGIRRDILMLVNQAESSYVTLIEQKFAEMRDLLENEDLDPDFAETSNSLIDALQTHLDNLAKAELSLADAGDTINTSYDILNQDLSKVLADINEQANRIRTAMNGERAFLSGLIFAVVILTLVAVIAASVLIVRSVSRNLSDITGATADLADGNVDCAIPYTKHKTEIGALARALTVFQENARQRMRLESEADAEDAAKAARQQEIEASIADFKSDILQLLSTASETVSGARRTANDLLEANDRNDEQAGAANEASQQASTNVETVASASQQLTSSIQEISAQIAATSAQVDKVSASAQDTNRDVDELARAATKIDEILLLIQAIAEQTNLLALNATIEAARAGEHGKGFSIVASEVKSLANQTASATEEISNQIKAIQQSSRSTVSAMTDIAGIIGEVQNNTVAIAGAIEEQTTATSEISRNVGEAAERTRLVADTISSLQATAAAAKTSAGQIRDASEGIDDINGQVKSRIDAFLRKVAAA
ncbi:methyl-accepting chemotaxis protein [uncultured Roseibium sp.]|uniref:methyl-accepting chemotaxis protein n=1 Tax=uncultured Roseibium sp. TaxID=1936171 RepID=UPI003218025C